MTNWETFKILLQDDLEAWDHFVSQFSKALENNVDLQQRKEIQGTLAPLLVYQEVTKHYLEVMEQIESGTYSLEDTLDGGTTEKLN